MPDSPASFDLTVPGPAAPAVPPLIRQEGAQAALRFVEFFTAHIRNPNTRLAYARACQGFLAWCQAHGAVRLGEIAPVHVAAWVEARGRMASAPTVKQELAAVRGLFDWLVVGQVVALNPAAAVRGPAHSASIGKTPVLSTSETRMLLRSIPTATIGGLRDRALIGVMVYAFARIGAVLGLDVGDVYRERHRLKLRLTEKGGKRHQMPCHHTLETYLCDYMDAAGLGTEPDVPLFQSLDRRRQLNDRRLHRNEALAMVRRRVRRAGIETPVCNHSFRAAGITAYLEHPDAKLEEAQKMAAHADPKTTRMYDRRERSVSIDEVERIRI